MSNSDWELHSPEKKHSESDWEIHSPNENESFGQALSNAPSRIIEDVGNRAIAGINAIPDYYKKAKTEIPGVFNAITKHPLHTAGQEFAGLNEGINSAAQFPLDISRYASNRLNILPRGVTNAIQKITPQDTTEAINQLLGKPKYEGETILRGGVRNALPIAGAARLARGMPHLTRRGASRSLNTARELAGGRNIGQLNIDPALIEDARQFLPNTLPHRNALTAAHTGDYNELFRLQSDVGKNSGDYAKSLFSAAERSHGRAGLAARNRLLDAIHENLQSQGHHDISNFLRKGQHDYSRYMRFKPYRNALALGLLSLAIPQNPISKIATKALFHNSQ